MRKAAVLVVMFAAVFTILCSRGVAADSGSARPYEGLSGPWEGTANGSLRGSCLNMIDQVHKIKMTIVVDDAGSFTAQCEHCPVFLPEMRARDVIAGKVDEKLHVIAAQEFVYSGRETDTPVKSAIRWTGDIKRAKDKLDLQLHAVVRVHKSTSNACVIDGVIKVAKPRQDPGPLP